MNHNPIDFAAVRQSVDLVAVASQYVTLRRRAGEFEGCCPFHDDRDPSFTIFTGRDGVQRFQCFGCDAHGDVVDFVARIESIQSVDAARKLTGEAFVPAPNYTRPTAKPEWRPLPTDGADRLDLRRVINPSTGRPASIPDDARLFPYLTADGEVIGYVARWEPRTGRKQIRPICWAQPPDGGAPAWALTHFAKPRPLYGLPMLAARGGDAVLVISGEACQESAVPLLGKVVPVTWAGGDNAIKFADWSPLYGRTVYLLPDLDRQRVNEDDENSALKPYEEQSGPRAMLWLADHLAANGARVWFVWTRDDFERDELPDKFDIGDMAALSWSPRVVQEWIRERARIYMPRAEECEDRGSGQEWTGERGGGEDGQGGHPDRGETGPAAAPDEGMPDDPPRATGRGEDWPPPADLFSSFDSPDLSREYLPRTIAEFAFDQADLLGVDPAAIALPALVTCAACLDDRIQIQPMRHDPTWTESARLWAAICGDPSKRKTPAIGKAVRPARKIDMRLAEESEKAAGDFAVAETIHKKQLKRHIDDAADGTPAGDPPAAPQKPPKRSLISEDSTIEALGQKLIDNPGGLLVVQDELTSWFGSMGAYKQDSKHDRGAWLQLYNGGPRRIDRIGRGNLLVPNFSCCLVGGIQPDTMRKIAAGLPDDGLLQRIMVVCTSSRMYTPKDRTPDMDAMNRYRDLVEAIHATQAPAARPVTLSEGAHLVRERVTAYALPLSHSELLPAGLRAHLAKWDGLFARLLLTYHAINMRSAGKYPNAEPVPRETAEAVEALLRRFLFGHAIAFYADVVGKRWASDMVEWVADTIIAAGWERFTSANVAQSSKRWRDLDAAERSRILDALETVGWIRPVHTAGGGKVKAWMVNPAVHQRYRERAERVRQDRQQSRDVFASAVQEMAKQPNISNIRQ